MASTFAEGIRRLEQMVGHGKLVGTATVDQIYALAIHSGYWRSGPLAGVTNRPRHGGQSHFLSEPLQRNRERYFRNLADQALEPGGLVRAMTENVEDASREVYDKAPREKNVLRNSTRVTVVDNGHVAYDRPAVVPRLSKEELKRRHEFVPRRHFGRER